MVDHALNVFKLLLITNDFPKVISDLLLDVGLFKGFKVELLVFEHPIRVGYNHVECSKKTTNRFHDIPRVQVVCSVLCKGHLEPNEAVKGFKASF